ncbi:hypothetical protein ACHAPJ_007224 [Fusarium lateritium]
MLQVHRPEVLAALSFNSWDEVKSLTKKKLGAEDREAKATEHERFWGYLKPKNAEKASFSISSPEKEVAKNESGADEGEASLEQTQEKALKAKRKEEQEPKQVGGEELVDSAVDDKSPQPQTQSSMELAIRPRLNPNEASKADGVVDYE